MTMYINQIVLNRYDLYLKTVSTCIVACVSGSFPGMDLHKFYMTPLLNTKELHDPPPICPSENYMTPYMYVSPGPLPCEYNECSPGSHLLRRPAAPDLGPP